MFVKFQIDLTSLGELMRANPSIVRKVSFKDGSTHQFVDFVASDKRTTDQYGNDVNIKVSLPKETPDDVKKELKWFVGKGKNMMQSAPTSAPAPSAPSPSQPSYPLPKDDTLPF